MLTNRPLQTNNAIEKVEVVVVSRRLAFWTQQGKTCVVVIMFSCIYLDKNTQQTVVVSALKVY